VTLSVSTLIDSPALGPRPFLTWYGHDGERVELSATVTANWVTKTANLLVEEFDAGPGTLVRLHLPPHWRTAVWALATWRVGAGVLLEDDMAADVHVTDRPGGVPSAGGGASRGDGASAGRGASADGDASAGSGLGAGRAPSGEVVVVSLPALARRFDGELPPGAIDAAQAVMTYADVIGYVPPLDPSAAAVVGPAPASAGAAGLGPAGPDLVDLELAVLAAADLAPASAGVVTAYDELESWAAELPPSARLAVAPGTGSALDVDQFLRTVLGALRAGTSLVFVPASHPDPARILATEHATPHP